MEKTCGDIEAERIRDTSAARGTNMHLHLEKHVLGEGHLDLTPGGHVAKTMADVIIEKGLKDIQLRFKQLSERGASTQDKQIWLVFTTMKIVL